MSTYPDASFETRMETVEFRIDADRAHITVDDTLCRDCSVRGCIVACPADLFVPTADGGILFNYENCFECGTCYLVCNEEGRHHLDLSGGRPRRRLPPELSPCRQWPSA